MTEKSPTEPRNGRIITFYSYKGGTGRTMALANVAWILAANGYRVLAADWDLESPGLHRFLYPFLEQVVKDAPGVIDLVRDYERVAANSSEKTRLEKLIPEHAGIQRYAFSLNWKFPADGTLDFLSPGKQNRIYLATLSGLDWDNFHRRINGGEFLDAVREDMKQHYDYVFIDSRTGLSDVADICTVQMPDILVDCFTLSTQGIEGAEQIARLIEEQYEWRSIRVLPVPMRVDQNEQEMVQASRIFATRLFEGLPTGMTDAQRRAYWVNVEVPYRAFYAFEENLAVFNDTPGSPTSMLSSFERIASYITDGAVTGLPVMDEDLRNNTRLRFVRRPPLESNQITVEFLPEDQVWAEWIGAVLGESGVTVRERRIEDREGGPKRQGASPRVLAVVSDAYVAWLRGRSADQLDQAADGGQKGLPDALERPFPPGFGAYVTMARLPEMPPGSSVCLAGAREEDAVDGLQGLLNVPAVSGVRHAHENRFPGAEPRIIRVGARNDGFTGREKDLRELREQLRSFSPHVARPIVLHGTGGVGKTQIALEYVHRFKNTYDLVWWVDCGQSESIDLKMADMAPLLRDRFGVTPPAAATVQEQAHTVSEVLSQGGVVPRWLLVYDNAEDIEAVKQYLPDGGGHILITSQNAAWADQGARSLPIELFKREESISYLRRVVPFLSVQEAGEIAVALGDLPLAVTAAAAYLRDSHYPVTEYLNRLQSEASTALSISQVSDYPGGVAAAWDSSLKLLQERSAAAARLLELCAVMAPEVALDLVYSPAMAHALEPYDPSLSEPMIMGRVVQEISKLALLKLDPNASQIQIHRLVQEVVRKRLSKEQLAETQRAVQQILVAARPRREVDNPATWSRYRLLWPHLQPADVVHSSEEQVRQLIVDRVRYIWVFSDFQRGVVEARAAERTWVQMLAEGYEPEKALRIQLLQLRFNLSNILRSLSRFREARDLDQRVLEEQTELLGRDHLHTLMTAGSLAADLRTLGHYHEALEMDRRTHQSWTELYGQDHRRTLSAANNLAVSLRLTGAVAEALLTDSAAYDRFRATLGPQNPLTLDTSRNVVRDLLETGHYFEAVARIDDVWQSSVATLGASSPAALTGQVLLGIALRSAGRPEDAEAPFDDALRGLSERFGSTSGEVLACRISRAANLLSLDEFESAEADIRAVLAEYEQRLGPRHPYVLVCRVNLASALRLRRMNEEAMSEITTALDGLEQALGTEHPSTLAAAMDVGVLLSDRGELEKAEEIEARTASSLSSTLGPTHPDTLRSRANMLLTQQQLGERTVQAELDAVITQLEALIGAEHFTIKTLRAGRKLVRVLDPQPF